MVVNLVGVQHRKGTSKASGKNYDFYVLYVAYPDPYVSGNKTQELNVNPDMISGVELMAGRLYDIDVGLNGRPCGIALHVPPGTPADRDGRKGGVFGGK